MWRYTRGAGMAPETLRLVAIASLEKVKEHMAFMAGREILDVPP